jgi:Molybdopterin-binding domain of aldehyde dehydrogenase
MMRNRGPRRVAEQKTDRNGETEQTSNRAASGIAWSKGPHACEVEIDVGTGESVDDVGTVINPMTVEGQIEGGIAQGFGQALPLCEHCVYDVETANCCLARSWITRCRGRAIFRRLCRNSMKISPATNPLGAKRLQRGWLDRRTSGNRKRGPRSATRCYRHDF